MTFKFFSLGLISFIKGGGSLTPFILRQAGAGMVAETQVGRERDQASHPLGPGARSEGRPRARVAREGAESS